MPCIYHPIRTISCNIEIMSVVKIKSLVLNILRFSPLSSVRKAFLPASLGVADQNTQLNPSLQSLATLKHGAFATIKNISAGDLVVRSRLFSMGLVEGRKIAITRKTLFGGTIGIEFVDSCLALRLTEAEAISILV